MMRRKNEEAAKSSVAMRWQDGTRRIWGTTPREFSPCGTVLDRDTPQLMFYPGRHYTYFEQVSPQIVEVS